MSSSPSLSPSHAHPHLSLSFTEATPDQRVDDAGGIYNYASCGTDGPVKITVPLAHTKVEKIFLDGLADLGVGIAKDPFGGDVSLYW